MSMFLTDEQFSWMGVALQQWFRIREEAGMDPTLKSPESLIESGLLRRLLTGHDPLPDPPPTFLDDPWYELIDRGRAEWLHHLFVYMGESGRVTTRVSIGGCSDWFVVYQESEDRYLLDRDHRWTGEPMGERWWLIQHPDESWSLERAGEEGST